MHGASLCSALLRKGIAFMNNLFKRNRYNFHRRLLIRSGAYVIALPWLASCGGQDNSKNTKPGAANTGSAGSVNNPNQSNGVNKLKTMCNPVDIPYRFALQNSPYGQYFREAADPTLILFNNAFYIFPSHTGGYYKSLDLSEWELIKSNWPDENYAPTVVNIDGKLYGTASSTPNIYVCDDLDNGKWHISTTKSDRDSSWDPCLYYENNKVYYYYGSNGTNQALSGRMLNKDFSVFSVPFDTIKADLDHLGWQISGDNNNNIDIDIGQTMRIPYMEGSWLNKIGDTYYLQIASPDLSSCYCDSVYISNSPTGPFSLAPHNPMSIKEGGFANGAGHGSTANDVYGNYWHITTAEIGVKSGVERRLVIYPTIVDADGWMYSTTRFGDYPYYIPITKINNIEDLFTGWMLLSYKKSVEVSSTLDNQHLSEYMVNENIKTYWVAKSGNNTEWASLDLGDIYDVHALQINFAEHNINAFGWQSGLYYQYIIYMSNDNINWSVLVDQSESTTDNSHRYHPLNQNVQCRYLKIQNIHFSNGNFAISGFRVFGLGHGKAPQPASMTAVRGKKSTENHIDGRCVYLSWSQSTDAIGYNIRYGIDPKKLYHNYLVYGSDTTSLRINHLNSNQTYYFQIESFNENGITLNSEIITSTPT